MRLRFPGRRSDGGDAGVAVATGVGALRDPRGGGPADPDVAELIPIPKLSALDQLKIWTSIATQSVGGGSATLYLMRRTLIGRKHWLTNYEFLEDWTLSRLSPGVTLIALTALLGKRLGGWSGVAYSIGGMLVPAAVITVILTGALVAVDDVPAIIAALEGMGPVTVGMMLGLTIMLARSAIRPGRARFADMTLVGVAVVVGFAFPSSPVAVILAGGVIGALFLGQGPEPEPEQAEE
jgi:chromate transporter